MSGINETAYPRLNAEIGHMDSTGQERLKQYQLEHIEQGEQLITQFRNVLTAFEDESSDPQRVQRVCQLLDDDPAT